MSLAIRASEPLPGPDRVNPIPLFLLYLSFNYHQTWHDGTLAQNLPKAIKILLISSLWGKHGVIKEFSVSFQVKIWAQLSFVQFGWNLAQGSILRRWFRIWTKKSDMNTFWARKGNLFYWTELKISPKCSLTKALPWQHPRLLSTETFVKWCPLWLC